MVEPSHTCPHISFFSSLASFKKSIQERTRCILHYLSWRTKILDLILGQEMRLRVCVTSTARPTNKRSLRVLCRFLCLVLCKILSIQDHGPFNICAQGKNEEWQVRNALRKRRTSVSPVYSTESMEASSEGSFKVFILP